MDVPTDSPHCQTVQCSEEPQELNLLWADETSVEMLDHNAQKHLKQTSYGRTPHSNRQPCWWGGATLGLVLLPRDLSTSQALSWSETPVDRRVLVKDEAPEGHKDAPEGRQLTPPEERCIPCCLKKHLVLIKPAAHRCHSVFTQAGDAEWSQQEQMDWTAVPSGLCSGLMRVWLWFYFHILIGFCVFIIFNSSYDALTGLVSL